MEKIFNIDKAIAIISEEVKKFKTPIVDLIQIQTKDPFKVLLATILSARTKDQVTADSAKKLFLRVNCLDDLEKLTEKEIEKLIYPVGFFKNKARYLKQLPCILRDEFNAVVPSGIDDLLKLPGVGRKTANLVRTLAFQKEGICVDTHVHRIMNIWKYVETKNPLETEMALREKLPRKYWIDINSILVSYGQSVCSPVSPRCYKCLIESFCPQNGVKPRKEKSKVKIMNKTSKTLKLLSWNVNGVRAVQKKGFVEFVKNSNADVIGIQETKAQKEQLDDELLNINGYESYWFSAKRKGYSGTAVYSKQKPIRIIYGFDIEEFDNEGRALTLEFDNFYFINCYYPNAQSELLRIDYKIGFNNALRKFANKLAKDKAVLITGDYNVAHKEIDIARPKANIHSPGFSPQERESMDEFINSGWIDTFRMFNNEAQQYTWWSYRAGARAKNVGWRLDYFCIDKANKKRVVDAQILSDVMGSDHCPVTVEISC